MAVDYRPDIEPSNVRPSMGTYNTPKTFRFWCQKVLPLVYDDSLSYYELLCKVVDYLNKTMEDVNTAVEDVTNLNSAFGSLENHVNASETALLQAYTDLQTYVNNYFDNLDVQEEINNKLDAMVADGTMDTIILPYFNEYVEDANDRISEFENTTTENVNNAINAQNQRINVVESEFNQLIALQTEGSMQGSKVTTFTAVNRLQYTMTSGTQSFAFVDYTGNQNTTPSMSELDALVNPILVSFGAYILNAQDEAITGKSLYVDLSDEVMFYPSGGYLSAATDKRAIRIDVPASLPSVGNLNGKYLLFTFSVVSDVPVDLSEITDARIGANNVEYQTLGDAIRGQINNINFNNLSDALKDTIGIDKIYSLDLTQQLTTVTGGFYQEGEYLELAAAKYYKLDCNNLDTIYVDRICPAWYDVFTVIDSDGNAINYYYDSTHPATGRYKFTIDVSGADYVAFSDDSYNHAIKIMGIPHAEYSNPYTKSIMDRFTTYIGSRLYVNGVINTANGYRYTEYNVMGINSVKINTYTEAWTDIYDLIDKDGNVISYEFTETKGYFARIIDVSNACYIRISTLNAKGGYVRIFAQQDYVNNKYADCKIAVVGDSWTEYNETNTENFIDLVCKDLGINWLNYGVGGSSYKATEGSGTAYYQRVQTADFDDCQAVLLFGSGNENTNIANGLLGTWTDNTSDTICGCVNLTIDNILTRYPLIKIAILAPAPWQGFPNSNANNNFERFTNALKTCAEHKGVPFLDLYRESNMRPWNADFRTAYQPDGCHPNNNGHKFLYPIVKEFVEKLLP